MFAHLPTDTGFDPAQRSDQQCISTTLSNQDLTIMTRLFYRGFSSISA